MDLNVFDGATPAWHRCASRRDERAWGERASGRRRSFLPFCRVRRHECWSLPLHLAVDCARRALVGLNASRGDLGLDGRTAQPLGTNPRLRRRCKSCSWRMAAREYERTVIVAAGEAIERTQNQQWSRRAADRKISAYESKSRNALIVLFLLYLQKCSHSYASRRDKQGSAKFGACRFTMKIVCLASLLLGVA